MAKRGRPGKQLQLIDVEPKNVKKILEIAEEYEEAKRARLKWLDKEKELKQKVLDEVKKADLQTLEGGVIRFKADGKLITITPRDELIKVKEISDE
jgi:hypothetical protein